MVSLASTGEVFVITVALELREGAVVDVRLHGRGIFDGDRNRAWHDELVGALGRPTHVPPFPLLRVEDGRAVLTLRSALGHPEQVAGEGTAVWEPL